MRTAGVREARQDLTSLLDDVRKGREVVITDRGRTVARLVPGCHRNGLRARAAHAGGPAHMPFLVGSAVAVVSLKKHGHVLDVLPGRRYRVAVGGLTMVCKEEQLETVSHSKKQQRREREAPTRNTGTTALPPVRSAADTSRFQSIDLHGMTVPDAQAALPAFLDRAIRAGLTHVRIIHGISGGRLRIAVRDYLAGMPAVTCAAPDDRNPGVTVAYF